MKAPTTLIIYSLSAFLLGILFSHFVLTPTTDDSKHTSISKPTLPPTPHNKEEIYTPFQMLPTWEEWNNATRDQQLRAIQAYAASLKQ